MTIIVALKDKVNKKIFMGADRLGSNGRDKIDRIDKKIFKKDNFLIGFTSSYRMGQILQYVWEVPDHSIDIKTDMQYMVSLVIPSIIKLFDNEKYLKISDSKASGGTFIIVYKDTIYTIYDDFQVSISDDNYSACGSGEDFALGSLFTTEKYDIDPSDRVKLALEAASKYSCGCGYEYDYLKMNY